MKEHRKQLRHAVALSCQCGTGDGRCSCCPRPACSHPRSKLPAVIRASLTRLKLPQP